MKKTVFVFILFFFSHVFLAGQNGTWTWMRGSTGAYSLGNFGTQGVPSPTNDPPALFQPAYWTDLNGNFWILGGTSANTTETALWKFNPLTNMWTWMKGPSTFQVPGVYGTRGAPDPANYPGSRSYGSCNWTDAQNNLWLFGGHGYDKNGVVGDLNDLWKYNIATNEWTWMNGSDDLTNAGVSYGTLQVPAASNVPPGRCSVTSWTDLNGDLWMFGGYNYSFVDFFSDMWRYSIVTNTWTWMSGSNLPNQSPVFGTKGIASPANTIGACAPFTHWTDTQGKFWIFGGVNHTSDCYASMWKYDPVTSLWTWMAGTDVLNDTSTFTEKCISAPQQPKNREDNAGVWVDECGHFWNFGGVYYHSSLNPPFNYGLLNDLWVFDPGTNLFTWVNGTTADGQPSVYGTLQVPAATNMPGGADGGALFKDLQGNFWIFGGIEGSLTTGGYKNTLWKYVPDTGCVKYTPDTMIHHEDNVCLENPVHFSISLYGNYDYYWDFGDPLNPNDTSTQASPSYAYTTPGVYHVTLYFRAQFANCRTQQISETTVTILSDGRNLVFPNVFTPNADAVNDGFPGMHYTFDTYRLRIYNRWGTLVFETNDAGQDWDGKLNGRDCEEGVYYWSAEINGCGDKTSEVHGFVELLR